MSDLFLEKLQLNPQQLEAVSYTEGPLLVLAGAGTGKTRVLTSRIAYIINSGKALPYQILAVTFTNKAAKEMQHRISLLCESSYLPNTGTFHSISAKILRRFAEAVGLTPNFSIIDQDDQIKIIKNIFDELEIDKKDIAPKVILGIISRWKDLGLNHDQISNSDIKSKDHILARRIYKIYQEKIHSSNLCDFGDLLLYNTRIFIENPQILEELQNSFKYILVDEYQDTNSIQYLWVRLLAGKHKNLCCVGDDDQSIYSWRGAEIANILRFGKDFPDAKIIALEQNYRSTHHILKSASSLIKNNPNRHKKTLWTAESSGNPITIVSCYNEREEARFIANYIIKINPSELNLSNVAVLVRAGFQTRAFEEAFINSSIRYRIIGGLKFYERAEIKDAIAYLRLALNSRDDVAFERIINTPRRSIGPSSLLSIKTKAAEASASYFDSIKLMKMEGLFKNKILQQIDLFIKLIEDLKILISKPHIPSKILKDFLSDSGYKDMLKLEKTEESRARLDNLNELVRAMEEYDSIQDFLEHASLVMDKDSEANFEDSINLMTLHSAKGLEFDTVFIPGMEEGLFPHQKSLDESDSNGIEEERRIAYVGITRAKKTLYLLYAETRRIFHEFVQSIPSRFIAELPKDSIVNISSSGFSKNFYLGEKRDNFSQNYTKNEKYSYKTQTNNFNSLNNVSEFRPGKRVNHTSFGKGVIIKKNGDNLEIAFDSGGIKTIKESFLTIL